MKIVKTGDVSRIFGDDLQTFDRLPLGNYKVGFHPMMGFYLEDADTFEIKEKPYGKHPEKIEKVVRLYNEVERNVGVILSGKKGMGKSMFAKLLSSEFGQKYEQMPTIIVTEAYPDIVEFIESIKQECIVIFDEFEKVFTNKEKKEPQEKLLGLFDGISQTKRLYVVTVNEIQKVNEYMINRPGRFHYHFQFDHPSQEEIEMYLKDKLKLEFHHQIEYVQRFANRFDLNYDSLRAIAFDLNMGYGFIETMEDLNISSTESESLLYSATVYYNDQKTSTSQVRINLMSNTFDYHFKTPYKGSENSYSDYATIVFSPLEIEIDNKNMFTVQNNEMQIMLDSDNEVLTDNGDIEISRVVFAKSVPVNTMYGKEMKGLV